MTPPAPPPGRVLEDDEREERNADDQPSLDPLPDEPEDLEDIDPPPNPSRARDVVVRDAHGLDPYGRNRYGADGEPMDAAVGRPPDELPSRDEAALRAVREREQADADAKRERGE